MAQRPRLQSVNYAGSRRGRSEGRLRGRGGEGPDGGAGAGAAPEPSAPGSRRRLQPCFRASPGSALAPLRRRSSGRPTPGAAGFPPPTSPGLPPLAPRSRARAGPGNCRLGRRGAFPPVARAQRSGGGGVSAASRPGVRSSPSAPPRPGAPQPRPLPSAGAGGRGRAGVFNGSMLPAAGAAPGQAGPPARPQPPRGHQLQLQLRALRLPQSPAALPGKPPSPRGTPSPRGLLPLFLSPPPPGCTSATPQPAPCTRTQRCSWRGAF